MKKIISLVLACIILSVLGISSLALDANIPYNSYTITNEDGTTVTVPGKTPIETPNFKPTIDGKKDAGYTKTYTVDKSETDGKVAHEGGSKLSTAWNGNTLYFYIEVPDVTPQENGGEGLWNWQRDGVWFMLFFGGTRDEAIEHTKMKEYKGFKVFPTIDTLTFSNSVNADPIQPPTEDDFEWKTIVTDSGYSFECAYTLPADFQTLEAGKEIAIDIEVFDMNDSRATYRYYLGNGYENNTENYCTAYGAKLVLAEAENVGTGDFTSMAVLLASVAFIGTALVIRKKH